MEAQAHGMRIGDMGGRLSASPPGVTVVTLLGGLSPGPPALVCGAPGQFVESASLAVAPARPE
eukprot:4878487-Pyramimonas_sp.AAC.1